MTGNAISPGEAVIEIVLAGVVLVVMGSALSPLLPWNFTLLGAMLMIVGIVFGVVMLGVALNNLLSGGF